MNFASTAKACVKPGHAIGAGDVLTFALGCGVHLVRVLRLGQRRGPAAEAQLLCEDVALAGPATATRLE